MGTQQTILEANLYLLAEVKILSKATHKAMRPTHVQQNLISVAPNSIASLPKYSLLVHPKVTPRAVLSPLQKLPLGISSIKITIIRKL